MDSATRVPTPIPALMSMVARHTKISKKKMIFDLAGEQIDDARHLAMLLAYHAGHDLDAIARAFGGLEIVAIKAAIDVMERKRHADSRIDECLGSYSLVLTVPAGSQSQII
jgi:chromosomal replication initiation ATPase DnaA